MKEFGSFVLTAYLTDRIKKEIDMAEARKHLKIWYDAEGDYLEVTFELKVGYFRGTESDQVMKKVDNEGKVLGFSVLRLSAMKENTLDIVL